MKANKMMDKRPKSQQQLIKLGERLAKQPNLTQALTAKLPRNQLALNPLLQKGGVHAKDDVTRTRKKLRRQTKQDLRKTDWLA
jgi:hypothetical protein